MNQQQALKLLGLTEGATAQDIEQALAAKQQDINAKQQAAPTDALKAKFGKILEQMPNAAELLLADVQLPASEITPNVSSSNTSSRSQLSQTKLADLPGMANVDAAQIEFQPGSRIAGRYEIKELIGQGGMGAVYRAYDDNRAEDIAIKVLLPALTKNERALERFLNEARVSSKLSHPNIVKVFDVQKDGDLYFLTMELLHGQDLRQVMDNQKTVGRPFEIEDVQFYIAGVCEALAHAHQTTVHRDVKPENIWINEDGTIKLMDFGIAQLQSTSQRTQTGAAMGTAYYMAPEQLKGVNDIDGRADQYAVAVLAYELLTGEVPAGMIEPVQELRPDVPQAMADAIHQALKPKPDGRFDEIQSFNQAIQQASGAVSATAQAVQKQPFSQQPQQTPQKQNNPLEVKSPNWFAISFVVILLLAVGGYFYHWQAEQAQLEKIAEAHEKK